MDRANWIKGSSPNTRARIANRSPKGMIRKSLPRRGASGTFTPVLEPVRNRTRAVTVLVGANERRFLSGSLAAMSRRLFRWDHASEQTLRSISLYIQAAKICTMAGVLPHPIGSRTSPLHCRIHKDSMAFGRPSGYGRSGQGRRKGQCS
jgi:hypothetical protein